MRSRPEYHSLTVAEAVDETADARSFVLAVPRALEQTFAYVAGQYCAFRATVGGEPVVRCYSMSSSPDVGDRLTVTVKRVAGGRMSNWMNDVLAPGGAIDVMPPDGRFVLRPTEAPIVAFAGGSGITPILSIVKTALATTARDVSLVYANRDADAVIFGRELERLRAASGGRLGVHHHLDAERGFLDAPACAERFGERTDADVYVCGPGPFMDVVQAGLARRNVVPERVFIERFELAAPDAAAAPASETQSLVIRIDRRKHAVAYRPGDTILEAARRAGLNPPFSCQIGDCATCMARVESGSAVMRANDTLTPDEVAEGWVLTCQAIPTSREVVVAYES